MNAKLIYLTLLVPLVIILTSCQPQTNSQNIPATISSQISSVASTFELDMPLVLGQTNLRLDGNRVVNGQGNIPNLTPIDITLDGRPEWVTAVAHQNGAYWLALLEDGTAQAFFIENGEVEAISISPNQFPAGMPPLLTLVNDTPQLVVPVAEMALFTHPVFINNEGHIAYIDPSGNLIIEAGDMSSTLELNAQLDARILVDENGRLLIHTNPTDAYPHAIMGDEFEGGGITLVEVTPEFKIVRTIPAPEGFVLEGIAPIWADLNGDGTREIIATQSNQRVGAQLIVFDELGNLVAQGPAIGLGNRWRHQLAVAPFGPDQKLELVDIRTPHIGGPTEFFQWQSNQLVNVATASGYTSHVIGSRNLDMAVAGPFDESGQMTLLAPSQFRDHLGGIQRTENGAEVVWTLGLNGRLLTNIYALPLNDETLALGVGTDDNSLRIWQPGSIE